MTTSATLPHPADLNCGEALMHIQSYSEYDDTFEVSVCTAAPTDSTPTTIVAMLMPALIGQYGEPDELVGRTFHIVPNIK